VKAGGGAATVKSRKLCAFKVPALEFILMNPSRKYRKDFFMGKFNKILISIIGIIVLVGVFVLTSGKPNVTGNDKYTTTSVSVKPLENNISYFGVEGKDALELLKDKVKVEQNASGLVTSINGRKAEDKKHEYWAFYINGKLAEVGPAQYKTKSTDKIEWKIEKY
jgi:hypothetical protein